MIINVALTGAIPRKKHTPSVPVTPDEIVADAIACADEGASIVHVHVRDADENPVHDREKYEFVVKAVREKVPDLVVCLTTSGRVGPEGAGRMTALELDDDALPDMASVTLGSFNFPTTVSNNPPATIESLLERMNEREIKPELEVFELGMINTANVLVDKGLIRGIPYFNILLGSRGSAPASVATLAHMVNELPTDSEWAAAGIGMFQRPMIIAGAVMGGNVRTGIEDAPRDHEGNPRSNSQAVRQAVRAAQLVGREIATTKQTRDRLGLASRSA